MFHKEGHKIIFISLVILVVCLLTIDYLVTLEWLRKILMLVSLGLFLLVIQFFRNPKRKSILDDNYVLSPVDGTVVVIEEVFENEYFKDNRIQVSIFMSPLNVHVTRYPVGGKVVFSKYHPGNFLVAWHPKSSEENERTTVVVDNPTLGKIMHRQIAGAMARRIVNYSQENNTVIQGADSGFIKFGSRVDVFLPLDTKINVSLNEKVKGGISIIAEK
mgnify:CR=1 FL=1